MLASCALDLAEDGPRTLDAVAGLMGMSKERARQIESAAMQKLQKALGAKEYHDLDEEF
jgi:DNA-directed RNA polymerase sigma subunit (sigma70/sigma32)